MATPAQGTTRRLGAYRRLIPYLREQRALIAGWLVFLAISSAATLALPAAARFMIDRGFGQTDPAQLNAGFIGLFGVAVIMAAILAHNLNEQRKTRALAAREATA